MANKTNANSEAKALTARRILQADQINVAILSLTGHVDEIKKKVAQHVLLESVCDGLYVEIDKLTKKAPADLVTNLVLTQVNDVVRETKQLCEDDTYIQRQHEFVAAGDNPEHRDALIVLTQLRQGLNRFTQKMDPEFKRLNSLLNDAKGIKIAFSFYLNGTDDVRQEDIRFNGGDVSEKWLRFRSPNFYFNFQKLDITDIPSCFA